MNRANLAKEISHVLELPIWSQKTKPASDKGVEILRVILATMTKALRSGEEIKIEGFGILHIIDRIPTRHGFTHFHGNLHGTVVDVKDVPAKRYVHFKPSKVLLRMLNEPDR